MPNIYPKNPFLKRKFNKNSKTIQAINLNFEDMISVCIKLCSSIFGVATSHGLCQTHQKQQQSLIHDFNNWFSSCIYICYCGLVLKGAGIGNHCDWTNRTGFNHLVGHRFSNSKIILNPAHFLIKTKLFLNCLFWHLIWPKGIRFYSVQKFPQNQFF